MWLRSGEFSVQVDRGALAFRRLYTDALHREQGLHPAPNLAETG